MGFLQLFLSTSLKANRGNTKSKFCIGSSMWTRHMHWTISLNLICSLKQSVRSQLISTRTIHTFNALNISLVHWAVWSFREIFDTSCFNLTFENGSFTYSVRPTVINLNSKWPVFTPAVALSTWPFAIVIHTKFFIIQTTMPMIAYILLLFYANRIPWHSP